MRIPIRIIGIVTSIFWIFLILFALTAVYSMKDMQYSLGDLETAINQDNDLLVSFPVSVTNTGYYNLASFNISMKILNNTGSEVAQGSTLIPLIPQGQTINTTHTIKVNVTDLLQTNPDLLFNDSSWSINEAVSMDVAEVIPVRASSNSSLPWGAPLHNLIFGPLTTEWYNLSHLRVLIPISFENHAFFNLSGTVKARIYGNGNLPVGNCQIGLDAPQYSSYQGNLEFYVPLMTASDIRCEALFETRFFTYGPMVVDLGS
jgi:hypothetical protein